MVPFYVDLLRDPVWQTSALNALAAWWLFGEALGPMRWAGMMLILAGVLVMSRT